MTDGTVLCHAGLELGHPPNDGRLDHAPWSDEFARVESMTTSAGRPWCCPKRRTLNRHCALPLDIGTISSYSATMRRKPGVILPLEASILDAAVELARSGVEKFHGFELAKRLRHDEEQRKLTAHGTLYKALSRMEKSGLLSSTWEDPELAAAVGRPRRRLYSITVAGRAALAQVERDAEALSAVDPGWSPS